MKKSDGDITHILKKVSSGDQEAFKAIWPKVYDELHKMAGIYLSKNHRCETLRPTAMVNEAYLKLLAFNQGKYNDKLHFFAVAAIAMRQILIDYIRGKGRTKRGGNEIIVCFDENFHQSGESETGIDLLQLNTALEKLEKEDPELSKIVELKFFGGLSIEETAKYLGISDSTIKRRWHVARLWLYDELSSEKKVKAG